jgi:hypothetical protein
MILDWKTSKEDTLVITKIARRAIDDGVTDDDMLTVSMDLTAVHLSVGLELANLLAAPADEFRHDIEGIQENINRRTGELAGCFVPRYATPQAEKGGK